MFAAAGVDDAGGIEAPAGLAHAFDSPVQRMVVGPRHDLKAELGEIVRHRRMAGYGVVGVPGMRVALETIHVDQRCLEVAVDGVALAQHVDDGGEALVAEARRERARGDAVTDGRQREPVGHAHVELPLEGPPSVEGGGVAHDGVGRRDGLGRRDEFRARPIRIGDAIRAHGAIFHECRSTAPLIL